MATKKKSEKKLGDLLREVQPTDLNKFGMIPEFTGRLPVVATLDELDEDALRRVLTEPKNALLKQYAKLLELDGVSLTFGPGCVEEIAKRALSKGTGARGLRAILEQTMLEIMYEVPARKDVSEVVVTADCIRDGAPPKIIPKTMSRTGT